MTNPVKVLFIGLLIALTAVAYKVNVDRLGPHKPSPKPIFEANFKTVVSIGRNNQGRLSVIGTCMRYPSLFKYYPDSVVIDLDGDQKLKYPVLGLDSESGLHVLKADSTELIFFRTYDPRPQYRALGDTCVLMIDNQHQTSFLFSTSSKCE